MNIEGGNMPVDLGQILTLVLNHTWELVKGEPALQPYEVLSICDEQLAQSNANDLYKEKVKKFVNDKIAAWIADAWNLFNLDENWTKPKWKSKGDDLASSIFKITKTQMDKFFTNVWYSYTTSLVVPGEAVGAVAAQSIGEPGTQMTL